MPGGMFYPLVSQLNVCVSGDWERPPGFRRSPMRRCAARTCVAVRLSQELYGLRVSRSSVHAGLSLFSCGPTAEAQLQIVPNTEDEIDSLSEKRRAATNWETCWGSTKASDCIRIISRQDVMIHCCFFAFPNDSRRRAMALVEIARRKFPAVSVVGTEYAETV